MATIEDQLGALGEHLVRRRPVILAEWKRSVLADPDLTTADSLPRTQFFDRIPEILEVFARMIRVGPSAAGEAKQKANAAGHGLHRWQQGYNLREVTREWGHLQLCLTDELEAYAAEHPELEDQVMPIARLALARLCSDGVSDSTTQYFELRQREAVGQVRDLEQALNELRQLETRRAVLWRQAAHDLRGNLGTVVNATAGLSLEEAPERSGDFLRLLQGSVASLSSLLDDVTSLARLQAGEERREVAPFDAADILKSLCDSLRPQAAERALFLKEEGASPLPVEGDQIKIRRIAQNLVVNALKYTQDGGVTVSWGDSRENDPERWMLGVHDTGPGIHVGGAAPIAGALEEGTQEARQAEEKAGKGSLWHGPSEPAADGSAPGAAPPPMPQGEGIGLSIVKRLCELLDATLELESAPGEGTTFRVILPRRYEETPR